jgi:hypothetical protein
VIAFFHVRLGTCIAVELLVGATTIAALGAGSAYGVAELRGYLGREQPPAVAAAPDPVPHAALDAPVPVPDPADAAVVTVAVSPPAPAHHEPEHAPVPIADAPDEDPPPPGSPAWHRGGHSDDEALAPLLSGAVAKVKFNHGGMTLSLRIDFDNGARAAFKPDQTNRQSNPRREIAAFRIDRLLGLDRVPPAIGRRFSIDEIVGAVQGDERRGLPRLDKEAIVKNGEVRGELSWWIPVIADGKVGGYPIDSTDGIVTWRRMLQPGGTIPAKDRLLVQQISDMIVFDFLIDNIDRWSGNNAKTSADGRVLYFMDNTMAFGTKKRAHTKSHTYLNRVHTFSKRLITALRGLTADDLRAALADDTGPFDELLTGGEIAAVIARRDLILDYVDALIAEHGEDKVLAFP